MHFKSLALLEMLEKPHFKTAWPQLFQQGFVTAHSKRANV